MWDPDHGVNYACDFIREIFILRNRSEPGPSPTNQAFRFGGLVKRIIGIGLIMLGVLALLTPFTPGSWLIFVGLEFLGFRILFWDKLKVWFISKQKHD